MSDSKALRHNPLSETEEILRNEYYGRPVPAVAPAPLHNVGSNAGINAGSNGTADVGPLGTEEVSADTPRRRRRAAKKPTHYKVVCISMYLKDIENLEKKVAELKRLGYTKANKSQLIRYALNQLDIENLPTPYDPLEST